MGWDRAVVKFRRQVIGLVQRRWVPLTLATVAEPRLALPRTRRVPSGHGSV